MLSIKDKAHFLLCAGVRAELLLGAVERATGRGEEKSDSASYLDQTLQYGKGEDGSSVLLDQQQAVMMEWERPLMQAHAQVVCTGRGDVLNVGFGLGIVDEVESPILIDYRGNKGLEPRSLSKSFLQCLEELVDQQFSWVHKAKQASLQI